MSKVCEAEERVIERSNVRRKVKSEKSDYLLYC